MGKTKKGIRGVLKILLVFSIILVLYNLVQYFTFHAYPYESSDHNFSDVEIPEKGRTIEVVEKSFERYKIEEGKEEVKLYRTFKKEDFKTGFFTIIQTVDFEHRRWEYEYMPSSRNRKTQE